MRGQATKLVQRVQAGEDPQSVLTEASRAWIVYTAQQAKDQAAAPANPEFTLQVSDVRDGVLYVRVNGVREGFRPRAGIELATLQAKLAEWMIFGPRQAYDWLTSAADKVSSEPVQEGTTTVNVPTMPGPLRQTQPILSVVPPGTVRFSLTSADPADGHVHEVVLDERGNGVTGLAGTTPHAHLVDRYVVRAFRSGAAGVTQFSSSHPGGVEQPKES